MLRSGMGQEKYDLPFERARSCIYTLALTSKSCLGSSPLPPFPVWSLRLRQTHMVLPLGLENHLSPLGTSFQTTYLVEKGDSPRPSIEPAGDLQRG